MFETYLMKSFYALGVWFVCLLANAIINKLIQKTDAKFDSEFFPFIKRMLGLGIWCIGLAVVLFEFGVINIMNLVTTAGVSSILIAMLIKDSVSNIIAGITIMFDRPFREGDVVKLATGDFGEVIKIGLRRTQLLIARTGTDVGASVLVIPNKDLTKAKVYNYTFARERNNEQQKEKEGAESA